MKLAAFLMKMNNNSVTIELKNGSSVQGTIHGADMMMNIHMTNVTLKTKKLRDGDSVKLEKFTVRGNTIRYSRMVKNFDKHPLKMPISRCQILNAKFLLF